MTSPARTDAPSPLTPARPQDAGEISGVHQAVAQALTARYGKGPWSSAASERGVLYQMRTGTVYVARHQERLTATLRLATRKPWAIDRKYFSPCARPLYLTDMAVDPQMQNKGVGRGCIEAAIRIGRAWPADAICLDAFDAEAGAGEFYRKCGFLERGRASYRDVPLRYFEFVL